jgi:hypothetical protein
MSVRQMARLGLSNALRPTWKTCSANQPFPSPPQPKHRDGGGNRNTTQQTTQKKHGEFRKGRTTMSFANLQRKIS